MNDILTINISLPILQLAAKTLRCANGVIRHKSQNIRCDYFSLNATLSTSITSTFCVTQQQFDNDSQLLISLSPSNFPSQIRHIEECLTAVCTWRSLYLNPDKSGPVLFSTLQFSLCFLDVTLVNVAGPIVPMVDGVKLFSVTLKNRLSMDK